MLLNENQGFEGVGRCRIRGASVAGMARFAYKLMQLSALVVSFLQFGGCCVSGMK